MPAAGPFVVQQVANGKSSPVVPFINVRVIRPIVIAQSTRM
jgi:hypothetical protein